MCIMGRLAGQSEQRRQLLLNAKGGGFADARHFQSLCV